jgi:hypothetical protein
MVCRLELHWKKELGHDAALTKGVLAMCSCCGVHAHYCIPVNSNRQIHRMQYFQNMSCFDIMHSTYGYEIWDRSTKKLYMPSKVTRWCWS